MSCLRHVFSLVCLVVVGCAYKDSPYQREAKARGQIAFPKTTELQTASIAANSSATKFISSFEQNGKTFLATAWQPVGDGRGFVRHVRKSPSGSLSTQSAGRPDGVQVTHSSHALVKSDAGTALQRIGSPDRKQQLKQVQESAVQGSTKTAAHLPQGSGPQGSVSPSASKSASLAASNPVQRGGVAVNDSGRDLLSARPLNPQPRFTPPLDGPLSPSTMVTSSILAQSKDLTVSSGNPQRKMSLEQVQPMAPSAPRNAPSASEQPRFKMEHKSPKAAANGPKAALPVAPIASKEEIPPYNKLLEAILHLSPETVGWSALVLIASIFGLAVMGYRWHINSLAGNRR